MTRLNKRILTTTLAILLVIALSGVVSAKKEVEYPFGFTHGMSQDEALEQLNNIGAVVTRSSEAIITADYRSEFDGITVVGIYMNFFDGKLTRIALDSEVTTSEKEHRDKLRSVSEYLKSVYDVKRTSNSTPISGETDLSKRYICRFQDNGFEVLIYSNFDNGIYSLSLNFVKINGF
jgi:hypothetical protein